MVTLPNGDQRPRKKPGRKSNVERAAIAAAAAAAPQAQPAKRTPTGPTPVAAAPKTKPVIAPALTNRLGSAAPAGKAAKPKMMDRYDDWMRGNPGQWTKEELIDVGVRLGWLPREDATRVFNVAMHRARDLFHVLRDGTTETYQRRAEVATPSSAGPGKIIRRRPGAPDTVRQP